LVHLQNRTNLLSISVYIDHSPNRFTALQLCSRGFAMNIRLSVRLPVCQTREL